MDRLIDELQIWIPNRERRLPLTGIEQDAFLAFSQGIRLEDQGNLEMSLSQYRRTLRLSPNFTLVEQKIEALIDKTLARGEGKAELLALINRLESQLPTQHLLNARLHRLGSTINAGTIPDQDTRKLPPGNIGELPAPPRPAGN